MYLCKGQWAPVPGLVFTRDCNSFYSPSDFPLDMCMLLLSALAYPAAPPSEVLRPPASERRELLRVRSGHTPLGSWEETTNEPMHKTVCDGRPCRPGEGNRVGYEHWKQPYRPLDEAVVRALSKKPPHGPDGPQYAKLVAAAGHLADASKFIALAAADFDYRELAENWHAAAARSGVRCALLYALDAPAHAHLTARLGAASVVNGTANLDAWATTKLMRHIQRALAERHMAAAALATAGFDVLLCDSTAVSHTSSPPPPPRTSSPPLRPPPPRRHRHRGLFTPGGSFLRCQVFVADPRPRLLSVPASDADVLVGRLHCNRPGKNRHSPPPLQPRPLELSLSNL